MQALQALARERAASAATNRATDPVADPAADSLADRATDSTTASELPELLAAVRAGELPHGGIQEYCRRLDGEEAAERAYLRLLGDLTEEVAAMYHGRVEVPPTSSDSVTD